MRTASESPAMFLAPAAPEAREVQAANDTPSVFAATLGLVSTTVALGEGDEKPAAEAVMPETTPQAAMQLAMMMPLPIALPMPRGEGVAEGTQGVKGAAQRFATMPAPAATGGIDLTKLEMTPVDQQTALPLEAALQQLTSSLEQTAATPESAPTRVITASHEIVEVVSRHVAQGDQQITMVLRPAELGQVKVRVEHVAADQVKITLEAERADATNLLHERVPELQAALAAQGLTVREVNVSMQTSAGQFDFAGEGGAAGREHEAPEETFEIEDTKRSPKRTAKRNPKDLDVLV